MAYTSSGRLPIERASKIGHIKIIEEPRIQRLMEAFETVEPSHTDLLGELSGSTNLSDRGLLENIVAIDGSHAAIPNTLKNHKRVAFITAGAIVLTRSQITAMKDDPIMDPRDLSRDLLERSKVMAAMLPLSGVTIPGETVVQTIRKTTDEILRYTDLYSTLKFLVSREWQSAYDMQEHMGCVQCGDEFTLPRSQYNFRCPHCSEPHTLSDYLSLVQGSPDDWAREQTAIDLRNVMETLILMRFLRLYMDRPVVLKRTLFVKDGPLLLHAQLSRLVDPIRAFFRYLTEDKGRELHVVGIEKTGSLVEHLPQIENVLRHPGDFFLPSVRYLHERIQGMPFIEAKYSNRVQYGSKVVVRLGPDHLIAFNVPTGDFMSDPEISDLYGFTNSMAVLSEMLSYSYENALIPLVLANTMASIAMRPSTEILDQFANRLLA
jgi:hypothetical protein